MYRELKLRGALIYNKQLRLLPLEQVYDKVRKETKEIFTDVWLITVISLIEKTNIYKYERLFCYKSFIQMSPCRVTEKSLIKIFPVRVDRNRFSINIGVTVPNV